MRRPWSELLSEAGLTPDEVQRALERVRSVGGAVDTALLELDLLPEATVASLLGQATDLPVASPEVLVEPHAGLAELLKQRVAEKYGLAPLSTQGRQLTLLTHKPVDLKLLDEVGFEASRSIRVFVTTELRVQQRQAEVYGHPLPARFASLTRSMQEREAQAAAAEEPMELVSIGEELLNRSQEPWSEWADKGVSLSAEQTPEEVWQPRLRDRIRAALTPRPFPALRQTPLPAAVKAAPTPPSPRLPPRLRDKIRAALTPLPAPVLRQTRPPVPAEAAPTPPPATLPPRLRDKIRAALTPLPAPVLRPTPLPVAPKAAPTPPPTQQPLPRWRDRIRAALTPRPPQAATRARAPTKIEWGPPRGDDEVQAVSPASESEEGRAASAPSRMPVEAAASLGSPGTEFDIDVEAETPSAAPAPPTAPGPAPVEAVALAPTQLSPRPPLQAPEEAQAAPLDLGPPIRVQPPPAAVRSHPSSLDALDLLPAATTRDAILSVALAEARSVLDFVALYVRRDTSLVVFEASGQGASGSDLRAASVPFERPSALRTVYDTRMPFMGPVPAGDPLEVALGWMGRKHLQSVLLYPVAVRGRTALIMYGDNGGRPLEPRQIRDLGRALSQVPVALERVLVAEKQRTKPPVGRSGEGAS